MNEMPDVPQHVIQRSRHAQCFSNVADRLSFLDLLCTFAPHHDCVVHAYVLMANHVHLLVTSSVPSGGEHLVVTLCTRYERYVVEHYGGDNTIWNEEPQTRPVHARRYLLSCMRYIELNPVRAGIVARPEDYRWSSYRANALGYRDAIVAPHPLYYALGRSPEARATAYARFVRRGFARPDSVSP